MHVKYAMIVVCIVGAGVIFMQDRRINNIQQQITATQHNVEQVDNKVNKISNDITVIKMLVLERDNKNVTYTPHDLDCMVRNIYFEAGVENDNGKYAVAQVTLNRLKEGRWGKNICSVVYAHSQFSWTAKKKNAWIKPKGKNWERSVYVATRVLKTGIRAKPLKSALYYHANYVSPQWKDASKCIAQIGKHIFYQSALRS